MKKITFYVVILLFIVPHCASFAQDQSNEDNRLQKIQSEIADQKQKLKLTRAQEQKALSSLYVIRRDLMRAQHSLSEAKTRVDFNKKRIVDLKSDLSDAQDKVKSKSEELKLRIREIYKSGSGGLLDILFLSRSMSDFINRSYYFGRIIGRDVALIGDIRQQVETIKRSRSELESANVEIKDSVRVIESEKRQIAQTGAEKERVYQSLKVRSREYEKKVRQLEASSYEFEKFIKARAPSRTVSSGRFSWPLRGRLTSPFGYRRHPLWGTISLHTGQDIAAPYGTPIGASDAGEVIFSGWWDGYGKAVVIDHGRGYTTVYGHMSRIYVQAGQKIDKLQVIGLVGSTGFSTGPHLHFEIRINGKPVDPIPFLRQ